MNPRLIYSRMTGRYYIATRYRVVGNYLIASRKYDVTDEVVAEVNQYRIKKAKKAIQEHSVKETSK